MKKIQAALAACMIAAAMSAPSIAFAQFSITVTFTGTAPASCDPVASASRAPAWKR